VTPREGPSSAAEKGLRGAGCPGQLPGRPQSEGAWEAQATSETQKSKPVPPRSAAKAPQQWADALNPFKKRLRGLLAQDFFRAAPGENTGSQGSRPRGP